METDAKLHHFDSFVASKCFLLYLMPLCTIDTVIVFTGSVLKRTDSVSGPMKYSSSSSAGRCTAGPINSFPFVWHLVQAKSVFPPTVCLELPPFGAKVCLHKWIHQEGGISWNWVKALQRLCTTTLEWKEFATTANFPKLFIWNHVCEKLSICLSVCLHYYTNKFFLNYIFLYILTYN